VKKTAIGIVFGALLLVGASRAAHASGYGYICNTEDYTPSSSVGNFGAVVANIYSGPSCTGSYLNGGFYCSTGASSGLCSLTWLLDEPQLMNLSAKLQRAAIANQKVFFATDGYGNLSSIYFYAAGY
jgi:hypothetical protein